LLELLGDKTAARNLAHQSRDAAWFREPEAVSSSDDAQAIANEIGYPLIVKAAFGGGGRGMRVVEKAGELQQKLEEARGKSGAAFGNDAVFLERFIGARGISRCRSWRPARQYAAPV
jgi:pyruvate carboxylase